MGKKDFTNIEKQIRDAMEDAINSLDFKQLNKTIAGTISGAVDEVRRQFNGRSENHSYREDDPRREDSREGQASEAWQPGSKNRQKAGSAAAKRSTPPSPMDKLRIHPPSKAESVLLTVFGAIGLSISLIGLAGTLFGTLFLFTIPLLSWFLTIILLIIGGVSGLMLGRGSLLRGRRRRLDLYLTEAGNRTYCTIRALVGRIGKPERYILRDLKRMIKLGILPHAHVDQEQTCLMLDDETYEQYLKSRESLKQRTLSTQSLEHDPALTGAGHQSGSTGQSGPDHKQADGEDRISRMISEGQLYLKALREANEAIPGEIITAKLCRLEIIIDKIFQVAAKHPRQADNMECFMEYYLPTTLKLVNAYRDFDRIGISGDNITMVKTDVEATLDTINTAFEQLLDGLYQDEAFDISTDASVLQTMLKKNGYGSSDFIKEGSK